MNVWEAMAQERTDVPSEYMVPVQRSISMESEHR